MTADIVFVYDKEAVNKHNMYKMWSSTPITTPNAAITVDLILEAQKKILEDMQLPRVYFNPVPASILKTYAR